MSALESSEAAPFAPLIGQKAQGCWLGYGSALFLEFGDPQSPNDLRNHRSGEWSLWCDQILWRIEQEDRVLGGCEDDAPTMDGAIEQLNGQILIAGQISNQTGDSLLEFTDRLVLRTFVPTSEEDARWQFRRWGTEFVAIGPMLTASAEAGTPLSTSEESESPR